MDLSRGHAARLTRLNLSARLQESVMARPFSPSEAKAVVSKAQELLGDIEVISKATIYGPDNFRDAIAQAKAETLSKELRRIKIADLQTPASTQKKLADQKIKTAYDLYCRGELAEDDQHVKELVRVANECADAIRKLYRPKPKSAHMRDALFLAARHYKSTLLAELYESAIRDAHDIPNACGLVGQNSGRLRWLLLNAADKQTTEAAYRRLVQFTDNSNSKFIKDGRLQANGILGMDPSIPLGPETKQRAIRVIAEDAGENLFSSDAKPNRNEIEAAVYGAEGKMPKRAITKLEKELRRSKNQIRKQVDKVRYADAQCYVSEQSVDMFKDLVPGVRVKCLKDAGYTTLNKIMYGKLRGRERQPRDNWGQRRELSRVNGISDGAADRIVDAIEQQVDMLAKNGKIKLNPDNKKPEDTALLQEVYKYFELEDLLSEAKAALARITEEFSELQDQILPALDAYTWLFYKDRDTVYGAYEKLNDLINGAELEKVNGHASHRPTEPDEKTVWKLFGADPIRVYNLLEKLMPEAFVSTSNGYGLPEKLANQLKRRRLIPRGLSASSVHTRHGASATSCTKATYCWVTRWDWARRSRPSPR